MEVANHVIFGPVVVKATTVEGDFAEELRLEGERLERLRHPNLARLVHRFDGLIDREGTRLVGMSTALVRGRPLPQWANERPLPQRLEAFSLVLDAVEYLHDHGLLHLDIKPANVLGSADGPVLLDLGSAQAISSPAGVAGGTLGYASPEVLRAEAPSGGSDIYSLGALLYELVSGRPPFAEVDADTLRSAVLLGRYASLSVLVPDLPSGIGELVDWMMSTDLGSRPDAIREVRTALRELGLPYARSSRGEPRFVGHGETSDDLLERVNEGAGRPIMLIGESGSGRRRLCRHVYCRTSPSSLAVRVDLFDVRDPATALASLMGMVQNTAGAIRGLVVADQETAGAHRSTLSALCGRGLSVLTLRDRIRPWASPFAVPALDVPSLQRLAEHLGESNAGNARAMAERANGSPGVLVELASFGVLDVDDLDARSREALHAVLQLPDGIPSRLIPHLPRSLQWDVRLLLDRGVLVRRGAGLYVRGQVDRPTTRPEEMGWAVPLLDHAEEIEGTFWFALLALRTAQYDLALRLVSSVSHMIYRPEFIEVTLGLHEAGLHQGTVLYGEALLSRRRFDDLYATLAELPEADPMRASLYIRGKRQGDEQEGLRFGKAWLDAHEPHPEVVASVMLTATNNDQGELSAWAYSLFDDPHSMWRQSGTFAAATLSLYRWRADKTGDVEPLRAVMAKMVEVLGGTQAMSRSTLQGYCRAMQWLGDFAGAAEHTERLLELADLEGRPSVSALARLNRANLLLTWGRAEAARDYYLQAESLARSARSPVLQLQVYASVAELEVRLGRLPSAEKYLTRFRRIRESLPPFPEAMVRGAILWASLDAARSAHTAVIERLDSLDLSGMPNAVKAAHHLYLMESLIELGGIERAKELADAFPPTDDLDLRRRVEVARGRIHVAVARAHFQRAMQDLPDEPDPLERETIGRTLLLAAGEDLDPASFIERRAHLKRASELLSGELQARAVSLHERIMDSPGATLDRIARLIEAIGKTDDFLQEVAQLVSEALGANRVLLLLRMPGLGRQIGVREISGQEAAGLGPEIMRRIQRPDDVWQSDDAFADPNLRRISTTVRTFQIKSVVAVAIPYKDEAIGALYVDDLFRSGRFTHHDIGVLQRLARAIGKVAGFTAGSSRRSRPALSTHDVLGVYMDDEAAAERIRTTVERFAQSEEANLLIHRAHRLGKDVVCPPDRHGGHGSAGPRRDRHASR